LPRIGSDGKPLPSTRMISIKTSGMTEVDERKFTSMLVAFGQFLDHDLDHVPVSKSKQIS